MKNKVMVIGLDGATFDLVKPWVDKGKLPTIKKLMDEGIYGELKSTFPPLSCPAWKSFSTGKNPGKLGAFGFVVLEPDTCKSYPVNADYFTSSEIWDILGEKGLKSGVVNMPMTYPPKKVNGFMIAGYFTPSLEREFTFPKGLKKEMFEVVDYRIKPRLQPGHSVEEFVKEHHALVEMLTKAAKHLILTKEWDFFLVVFREIDIMQHWMWKYMDEDSPGYNVEENEKYGKIIEQYWEKIDAAIGKIISELDKDTSIVLMSDHGFGRVNKSFNVNDWLIEKGFLKLKNKGRLAFCAKIGLSNQNLRHLLQRLKPIDYLVRKLIPREHLIKASDKIPGEGGITDLENTNIDWRKSKAFDIGEVTVGSIYINTKRRPEGIVEPGHEYERLRNEIIEELQQIVDPQTGRKLKVSIYKPEELYSGKLKDKAPDIMFTIENLTVGIEPTVGHKSLFTDTHISGTDKFSGLHRDNGLFIARGPAIRAGKEIEGAQIIDLAPTILHMMDVPIPKDMDGRVLKEIFEESSRWYEKKPEYQEPMEKSEKIFRIKPEDETEIRNKLRGLGYM